jgi:hypothetical protein
MNIDSLPTESLQRVFCFLIVITVGDHPLRAVRQVSRRWRGIASAPRILFYAPLPSRRYRRIFPLPSYAVRHLSLPTSRELAPYIAGTELLLFGNPVANFDYWHRPHWVIFQGELILPLLSRQVPRIYSGQHTICRHFKNWNCERCRDSTVFVPPVNNHRSPLPQDNSKQRTICDFFKRDTRCVRCKRHERQSRTPSSLLERTTHRRLLFTPPLHLVNATARRTTKITDYFKPRAETTPPNEPF